MQIKPQRDATSHPLQGPKWKIQTITSVGKDVEKEDPAHTAGRNIRRRSGFGKQFGS